MYFEFLPSLNFTPTVSPGTYGLSAISGAASVAFDSTQGIIWVSNGTQVYGINPLTLAAQVSPSQTFSQIASIAYDPNQNLLWVADIGNNSIKSINPVSGALVNNVSTISPRAIAYDAVNNAIWVADSGSYIARFSAATGSGIVNITANHSYPSYYQYLSSYSYDTALGTCNGSGGICFDAYNNRLWYASPTGISYINAATNSVNSYWTGQFNVGSNGYYPGYIRSLSYNSANNSLCVYAWSYYYSSAYSVQNQIGGTFVIDVPSTTLSAGVSCLSDQWSPIQVIPAQSRIDVGGGAGLNYSTITGGYTSSPSYAANFSYYLGTGSYNFPLPMAYTAYDNVNHRMWGTNLTNTPGLYWLQLP